MYLSHPIRRKPFGLSGLGYGAPSTYLATGQKAPSNVRPVVNSTDPRARARQVAAQAQYDADKLALTPWGKKFSPPPLVNGRMTEAAILYTVRAWQDGLKPAGFKTVERVGVVPMYQPGQQAYGAEAARYLQLHAPEIYNKLLEEMRKRDRDSFIKSMVTIATIVIGGYLAGSAMAAANASAAGTAATVGTTTTGAGVTAGTTGAGMTASAGTAAYSGQIAAAQVAATQAGAAAVGTTAAGATGSLVTSAAKTAATTVAKGALAQAKNVAVSYVTGKASEKVADWLNLAPEPVPDGSLVPPMQNALPQNNAPMTQQQMVSAGIAVVTLIAAVLTFSSNR